MRNWFFSLQFRMIVVFALVLILALGSVSSYIGFAAQQEVGQMQKGSDRARASRIEQTLSDFYTINGGWTGLQSMIERAGFLSDRQIVVIDEDGQVVGDSRGRPDSPYKANGPESRFSPIMVGGNQVGSVMIGSDDDAEQFAPNAHPGRPALASPPDNFLEPPFTQFAESVSRSLIWAGLAGVAGGVLLISLLSRRMLSSVRALNSAARRLGQGDLSQRVPAQGRDEIGLLGRTFNTMAEGLENAQRQRRNMTADVAHELRTPLSNVQGYIEAVRDGLLEPDNETLDTIHEQVLYLSRLVDDLKLLAETEAEDFRLNREPGSLSDVVRTSAEAFYPRAEVKGITITLNVPPESPPVELDRTRIEQVVGNLMENAIHYTPTGGQVTVSVQVEEARATVVVADSGEGISPEALPHLFDRLYRADPSRARTTGGAGLGLTIAKQLVEAHGGTIRVESAPGEGSRFIFDLPLRGELA